MRHVTRAAIAAVTLAFALGCSGMEIPGMPGMDEDGVVDEGADEGGDEAGDEAGDDDEGDEGDEGAQDSGGEADGDVALPDAFSAWPIPLEGGTLKASTDKSVTIEHTGDPIEMAKRYTREGRRAGGFEPAERHPEQNYAMLRKGSEAVKLSWSDARPNGTFDLTLELQ